MKLRLVLLLVGLPLGLALLGLTIPNANAQTETNLHTFGSFPTDGAYPEAGLVQGSDGSFYGTTCFGGSSTNCSGGCGTVFRISPSGTYTSLHSFAGSPHDGAHPAAGLVQGSNGNFYGTTAYGGTNTYGDGTVFRISPTGTYTTLYSFAGSHNDGAIPEAGLVQGSDGNFYGTTVVGGSNNNGTVFRVSPSGSYTNLYSFAGFGTGPIAKLVPGSDGNLYGTTPGGGTSTNCSGGCGTVFRISPTGTYTTLYSFVGDPTDGDYPAGELVQSSDGSFYGTTEAGGASLEGTLFRVSTSGSETVLYSCRWPTGFQPQAGLAEGSDGNLYGTTRYGGNTNLNNGTVFRISPSGNYTNLYSFGSQPGDGQSPQAGLVQGSDGSFYGTTYIGGTTNEGTVFKLTVPLDPPPWPINQITRVRPSSSDMVFDVVSVAYETYQLQFSSSMNPTNWINVPGVSVTNSIGALLTLTNVGGATGPQGFYRFAITP